MPANNYIIGLLRASFGSANRFMADPTGMGLLATLFEKSIKKTLLKIRKTAFENMMKEESYRKIGENIIIMNGAQPNETELQTAVKLAKTNEYYLVFPNNGQIEEVRALTGETGQKKNDIYLIDKISFKTVAVDIKTCGDPSIETIKAHLLKGVDQAPNIILDITGKTSKIKVIKGIRGGWSRRLRSLLLNYHGQWYLLNRGRVFNKEWLEQTLK